jgi:hypothetical protein
MVDYLKRTGCNDLGIRKEAELDPQTDAEIDEYVGDIKRLFLEQFKRDPTLKNADPNRIWRSMENFVRKDVNKLLEKKAKMSMAK